MENKRIEVGSQFGKWTVLEIQEYVGHGGRRKALCKCECGTVKWVVCSKLTKGLSKSCGCWKNHVKGYPRLYKVYGEMIRRCSTPTSWKFKDYGARGISVCDEWKYEHGFDNFAKWAIENGYNENAQYGECTLDRIDVNGDYTPENCRWVNLNVQANNKRNTIYLTYNNETHTISEWGDILNISRRLIELRHRRGYPIEDILFVGNLKEKRK